MAYQVIARKWRPQRFSDMVGQEHIARTLKNAIISGRIAQAYLFVGPRGIGKTTSARIFAKALNCQHPVDGEPCCECDSCKAIAEESSVDVIEIDAATHTQVEKAREICEDVIHLPLASKYKIYIIDEVHMLSKSAWNALLKTIEEPPEHAKFIFATTEVNKVLPTVISRCQRFDLRRIPANLIADRLEKIAAAENVAISRSAINVIARAADGGMRDAQSLLDQMISFFASGTNSGNQITEEQALTLFGLTAPAEMSELIRGIIANQPRHVISAVHHFSETGKNLEILFDEILVWLRGIMMCSIMPNPESVIDENPEKIEIFRQLAGSAAPGVVQRLLEQFSSTGFLLREAINKQVFIETLLLKGMRLAHAPQAADLIARLNYIRRTGELAPLDQIPSAPMPQIVIPPAPQQKIEQNPVIPKPEPTKPEPTKPEPTKPESPKPEPTKPEPTKPEPTKPESPKPESPKPESPKTEPPITEPPKTELPKTEPPITEPTNQKRTAEVIAAEAIEDAEESAMEATAPERKKKSLNELMNEAKEIPIIQQAVKAFSGSIADVYEETEENENND